MKKIFRSYHVWPQFPSLSMSGNACALHCKHCNHTYLNDMQPCTHPEDLIETCRSIADQGAVGFLLSGGCDISGEMLNLRTLLPAIKQIKQETNLIIKLHTGIVDNDLAQDIGDAGVDIASVEVVGSNQTIHDIFDYEVTVASYQNTLYNLSIAKIPYIVPHVCIGLDYGNINGEFHALDMIKQTCTPALIVFIVFRPTKGTPLASCKIPSPADVKTVISYAHQLFPTTELSLGCIRPRTRFREDIERAAVDAGVTRMEIPSKSTLNYVQEEGFTIRKIHACCALPQELEKQLILV